MVKVYWAFNLTDRAKLAKLDKKREQQESSSKPENSFKGSSTPLALYVADILSCIYDEKALSLQSCRTLIKQDDRILITKIRFTRKQQEKEAGGGNNNIFAIQ